MHATLTLRERHPRLSDDIAVYATDGPELQEFLALVAQFNARAERPTRWRPCVATGGDPLERLLTAPPGDVVVLAGRNDRKTGWMRRLHDAGMAVLADKPWLAAPEGLADVRHVLAGEPFAMEMLTGRHEVGTEIECMLAADPEIFDGFRLGDDEPAIVLESVHHLAKHVNGAPLRRPPWFFDVRVQGDGIADIPTHMVDHVQRLLPGRALTLVSARRWPTPVPRAVFARITGEADFAADVAGWVDGDTLGYLGNGELRFRAGDVLARCHTRWALSEPPGGGDISRIVLGGRRADLRVERSAQTGWTRRILVEPRANAAAVEAAVRRLVAGVQEQWPGVTVAGSPRVIEVVIPPALRVSHEAQFPLVLDEFLRHVDASTRPTRDTLAKYELLAAAMTACRTESAEPAFR